MWGWGFQVYRRGCCFRLFRASPGLAAAGTGAPARAAPTGQRAACNQRPGSPCACGKNRQRKQRVASMEARQTTAARATGGGAPDPRACARAPRAAVGARAYGTSFLTHTARGRLRIARCGTTHRHARTGATPDQDATRSTPHFCSHTPQCILHARHRASASPPPASHDALYCCAASDSGRQPQGHSTPAESDASAM